MKITKPGLYPDLPEADYRSQHEWLSVSGAKKLLPPSCPAKFKATLGEEEHKPQFDIGKAFHAVVLGDGCEVVVHHYDPDVVRSPKSTNAWKEEQAAVYARGGVLLLSDEYAEIEAMAAAVKAHDTAPHLFRNGAAEVSAFWVDEATGVQCKARFDYLPEKEPGRRLIVPDLKSAVSVAPAEFSRAAARFGYIQQQVHYLNALRHLGINEDAAFLFVAVEKDHPHLVNVGQFARKDDVALTAAALDKALRIYRDCLATDTWPGWSGITDLELPTWHLYELEAMSA